MARWSNAKTLFAKGSGSTSNVLKRKTYPTGGIVLTVKNKKIRPGTISLGGSFLIGKMKQNDYLRKGIRSDLTVVFDFLLMNTVYIRSNIKYLNFKPYHYSRY